MSTTRRVATMAAGVTCVAGVLAGCAATVDGSGSLAGRAPTPAPSTPSTPVTSSTPATSFPSGPTGSNAPTGFPSTSSSASGAPGALPGYLLPSPPGSQRGTSTWATTTSPTAQQFVEHFYAAGQVSDESARLRQDGLSGVAHNLWLTDQIQTDVVLLQFDDATGAQTRHTGIVEATSSDKSFTPLRPGGDGDVTEFYATKADGQGNIESRAYAVRGDVTVEVFSFSPTFLRDYLTKNVAAQVDKLP